MSAARARAWSPVLAANVCIGPPRAGADTQPPIPPARWHPDQPSNTLRCKSGSRKGCRRASGGGRKVGRTGRGSHPNRGWTPGPHHDASTPASPCLRPHRSTPLKPPPYLHVLIPLPVAADDGVRGDAGIVLLIEQAAGKVGGDEAARARHHDAQGLVGRVGQGGVGGERARGVHGCFRRERGKVWRRCRVGFQRNMEIEE